MRTAIRSRASCAPSTRSRRSRRIRWPSHGLPFRGAAVRVAQLRAHHAERLAALEGALREADAPRAAADLLPVLFPRALDLQQRFFAMGEAIAHLNHLWHAGRASRVVAANGCIAFAA